MMMLVFDIEADNLLPDVTQIWCVATQDALSGEKNIYAGPRVPDGIVALRAAQCLSGHNIIGYDLPALWKVLGPWDKVPLILDTLVVSRALFPERPGGHSLEAWGKRLGCPKGDFNDFSQYTPEMGRYCQQDAEVNVAILRKLNEEMERGYETTLQGYEVF